MQCILKFNLEKCLTVNKTSTSLLPASRTLKNSPKTAQTTIRFNIHYLAIFQLFGRSRIVIKLAGIRPEPDVVFGAALIKHNIGCHRSRYVSTDILHSSLYFGTQEINTQTKTYIHGHANGLAKSATS